VTLLVTVLVECAVLYGLSAAFFSHPQTRHMLLPVAQVERHLFSSPSTSAARCTLPAFFTSGNAETSVMRGKVTHQHIHDNQHTAY